MRFPVTIFRNFAIFLYQNLKVFENEFKSTGNR